MAGPKLSFNKKEAREDKGTPRQEVKAARAKPDEKPMNSNMSRAMEHMKYAEMHHREAKKCMSKCKK
jgi:hypothetical protein